MTTHTTPLTSLSRTVLGAILALTPLFAQADWYVSTSNLFGLSEIRRYDDDGNYVSAFGTGGYVINICLAPDGRLLVGDYGAGTIRTFDLDGNELGLFASGLQNPMGIVFDYNGEVLVAEEATGNILRFADDGTPLGTFASTSMSRQNQLAIDSEGNVYTCSHNEGLILRFDRNGVPLGTFADGSTGTLSPAGLAFDDHGRLYVSETLHHVVSLFERDGTYLGQFAVDNFIEPEWLTFDAQLNLLVPGYQSANIRRFDRDGLDLGDVLSPVENAYHAVQSAHTVAASRFRIVRGRRDQGDEASLWIVDGNVMRVCRFVVPNTIVDPVSIEVAGNSPADAPREVTVRGWSRMANAGAFRQLTELLDTNGAAVAGLPVPLSTTLSRFSHTVASGGADLTNPDGEVVARISVRKTGPSTVAQWCFDLDQLDFYVLR